MTDKTDLPPKVIGIFDKKAVAFEAPMSEEAQARFDEVVAIAKDSGGNKVKAWGVFLLHEDGTLTRSFSVDTGYWCAAIGAAHHLEWALHAKYNE